MAPFIGILQLDTAFPRILGDVGNPASYPMPVRIHVVEGAEVPAVVRGAPPDAALIARFVDAARALEAEGAVGLLTSCGFLAHAQAALAEAVRIPVIASALSLAPLLRAMTGGRRIGVLTADSRALNEALLATAGLTRVEVAIAGLEDAPEWQRLILAPKSGQSASLDRSTIAALAVRQAVALCSNAPDVGVLLLECGNLPPYADAIRAATGRPVFHILHAAGLLWQGHTSDIVRG